MYRSVCHVRSGRYSFQTSAGKGINTAFTALLAGVLLSTAVPATAQTSALSFTGGSTGTPNNNTMGWIFTLSAPATVGALGVWDQGGDGLAFTHDVSIWNNSNGSLLLRATISSGTSAPLTNGFRYSSSITVSSGTTTLPIGTYVIAAGYASGNTDVVTYGVPTGNITTAPGVTYVQNRITTGVNVFPTASGPQGNGFFGANFLIGTVSASAPEPGTFALLTLGTFAGGVIIRRGRRK